MIAALRLAIGVFGDRQGVTRDMTDVTTHVVYVGDSLARYSYLERVYRHVYNAQAPTWVINEKMHKSWSQFFRNTTFPGMQCDCHRSQEWNLGTEYENRYYTSKHKGLRLTYIQAYGDNMAHGRTPNEWGYMGAQWPEMLRELVLPMQPTCIVVNAGVWPHRDITARIHEIMSVPGVVWRETHPQCNEKSGATDLDNMVREKWPAAFVPFPRTSHPLTYFDCMHFNSSGVYFDWNLVTDTYCPYGTFRENK